MVTWCVVVAVFCSVAFLLCVFSAYNVRTRFSKHTGGNCLVTGNFLSLQKAICSSTLCINSRGQCTYLHQSKDLMLIVYESLNEKLKLTLYVY